MVLEFREVTRSYGATRALDAASFALEPGTLTVVAGDNGAGKTTLLRLAALLERPTSGAVHGVTRERLAWLGQEPGLYDELTVRENLAFYARFFGRDAEVVAAATTFSIAPKLDVRARHLSRGEKQRAALARALLGGALMVLDEPTSALDADAGAACVAMLSGLRGARTMLVATHDAELVKRADRVLRLDQGRLV
ncbi:MAG TPA: ABC transporter ATP-binding protein [Candidatus Thermoplasmatota archaeon]|nr:ABC transporter ATP-binding protein [Candidatus Thermoplasmatota archaeon]